MSRACVIRHCYIRWQYVPMHWIFCMRRNCPHLLHLFALNIDSIGSIILTERRKKTKFKWVLFYIRDEWSLCVLIATPISNHLLMTYHLQCRKSIERLKIYSIYLRPWSQCCLEFDKIHKKIILKHLNELDRKQNKFKIVI